MSDQGCVCNPKHFLPEGHGSSQLRNDLSVTRWSHFITDAAAHGWRSARHQMNFEGAKTKRERFIIYVISFHVLIHSSIVRCATQLQITLTTIDCSKRRNSLHRADLVSSRDDRTHHRTRLRTQLDRLGRVKLSLKPTGLRKRRGHHRTCLNVPEAPMC
ncbi:uncharacterized protein K489DRAFT_140467 [Dissoconium aciculare CBS 342.82]|jgi:hypothetical protein|uniref:Uncharacterized protein n=1 Tax=Dissoconium aciculare CBS 342.82 TaxID=1314786 RepID=A0A6J3LRC2_9PEZI|nr:uncharacterized protein K489DRAFT_140467 [Dissoconium aciculare CBS 342.82]KAF1817824.1 hypothetical protein K489DRAFT_140467 [Dissoconium aciculare CBS 342.82]